LNVRRVHVTRAKDNQRRIVEEALHRWILKPYEVDGRSNPVETGLMFKSTTGNEESR
jgi:hypothetical protein